MSDDLLNDETQRKATQTLGRSLVQRASHHGHTGLMISYLVPDGSQRHVGTLTDFGDITARSDTGGAGWLLRRPGLRPVEAMPRARGVLSGRDLEVFFRLSRPDELIRSQIRTGWLTGETPPDYDVGPPARRASGPPAHAPPLGSDRHPATDPAPGSYVLT